MWVDEAARACLAIKWYLGINEYGFSGEFMILI